MIFANFYNFKMLQKPYGLLHLHHILFGMKHFIYTVTTILLISCNGGTTDQPAVIDESLIKKPAPQINYTIVNVYPHDTSSYTQGLELHNGKLYESTGDYTNSALQIVDVKNGRILKKHKIGKTPTDSTFGEGITIFNGKLYQLTWQDHIIFVYDVANINTPIKTINWLYDGWGITNNGKDLIISDGSANLYFTDAETFKVKSTLSVTEDGNTIENINELEFIDGHIFANVYGADIILRIDPTSGHVVGKINLAGILQKYAPAYKLLEGDEVLNGIAYDSTTKKLLVTGKHWPKLFEITLQ